jgi:hypothetical protein
MGVRKYVYRNNIPDDLDPIIRARVEVFVTGLAASMSDLGQFLPELEVSR